VIAKRVVLTEQARREVRHTTAWYREEGGVALAQRWATALEGALRHIGAHPQTGVTRYAVQLKLDDLRFWPVDGFPYLVFYIEREQHIDVGRVLHGKRDIPGWMGEGESQ
jgi:toxin ParE1/3/4